MWPFKKQKPPPIAWFSGESEAMNAAISEAQSRFSEFRRILDSQASNTGPALETALVKYAFVAKKPGAAVEHVYVGDIESRGGSLWGIVNANPVYTDEVVEGDVIPILPERVSDWLYVAEGAGVGGFTFRLMWNNFSSEEKAAYRSQPPFVWLSGLN